MCHLYPYKNVKLPLWKFFFYINIDIVDVTLGYAAPSMRCATVSSF